MEKRRGSGGLIALVIILVLINLLTIGGGFVFFQKYIWNKSGTVTDIAPIPQPPTGGTIGNTTPGPTDNTGVPMPTDYIQHDPENAKHVESLKTEIQGATLPEGATAIVSVMDGSEYLKLTMGEYAFYYRNDYVKYGNEPYGKVIIEKGNLKREFSWDYSLKAENIGRLLPVIFDWRDNKREQMAFVFKKMDDREEECKGVHFVTCLDLVEYHTLSPEMGLKNSIAIGGFVETDTETLVCVVNESRKYYISAGRRLTEAEKSSMSLSVLNDIKYSLLNERVFVSSKVFLQGIGWIGEMSSRITYSTFDIFGNHSNIFYCYAEQLVMAADEMLIVTPVKDYEDTRKAKISLTGDNGEKMIFFAKDGMKQSWQDPSLLVKNENGYMEYKDPSVETSWGVDVSKFNNVTNWNKVKEAGFEFAIVRMGYRGYGGGTLQDDNTFKKNIEGALNAGMQVGVYYFTQAISVEEAIEEADAIVDAIRKYNITYPVIFDTEFYSGVDARANYMPAQLRTDIIKAFCERVKNAGYTPMIYSSTNWSLLNYDRSQLDEYDFWYAYYGLNVDYPYHYEILQYTSEGDVPGISGVVDLNISFKKYKK